MRKIFRDTIIFVYVSQKSIILKIYAYPSHLPLKTMTGRSSLRVKGSCQQCRRDYAEDPKRLDDKSGQKDTRNRFDAPKLLLTQSLSHVEHRLLSSTS